jgi:hypothetical protein
MNEENTFQLTAEELNFIEQRRAKKDKENQAPMGIGTGRVWAKAKIKGKRFLDEYTYIEQEGKYAE